MLHEHILKNMHRQAKKARQAFCSWYDMKTSGSFFSGTSNVVVPIKQSEYPSEFAGASRLSYYASLFTSVEINSTFYKLPKAATVEKWRESVPDHFRFTFKVPKAVTHVKRLQFQVEDMERFTEVIAGAGEKKGCVLVQLPPSVQREQQEELEAVLECLRDDAPAWKVAVEFRHNSWYEPAVYRVLRSYGATMVEHDMSASKTPPVQVAADFAYLRFHGPEGKYGGSYHDSVLANHAARIAQGIHQGKDVYVYFNNTLGAALGNLQTLNGMVAEMLHS